MLEKMHIRRRHRGAATIYVVVTITVLMGLTSLAVDLGRYELAHSSLYNAAIAGSRAGAMALAKSGATTSSVTTAATNAAIANSADGQSITSSMVTVQLVKWNTSTNTGSVTTTFNQANAVRVYISYTVPLTFGQAIGISSKTAVEYSTSMVSVQTDNPTVYATGNPWLAGEPAGTTASQPDPGWNGSKWNPNTDHIYQYDIAGTPGQNTKGQTASTSTYTSAEPYSSPALVAFTVTPGSVITITNASGSISWDHNTSPFTDPTGNGGGGANPAYDDAASNGVSEHGIADVTSPLGSMLAVFLGSSVPDNISSVPSPLDFSTQAERDYVGLEPQLQQPFYVGNGQTSGGTQQTILVPKNATRMYIGVQDGWEWSNNNGSFACTVTQTTVTTVQ